MSVRVRLAAFLALVLILSPLILSSIRPTRIAAQTQPGACLTSSEREQASPVATGDAPSRREQLAADLEAVMRTYASCLSMQDYTGMSRLVTESFLGATWGGGPRMSRETFIELAGSLPPISVRFRDLDDLTVVSDGQVRANVKMIRGNQLTFERMIFVEEERRPGSWLIDSASPLRVTPPREHSTIDLVVAGDQYSPSAMTAQGPNVEMTIQNSDVEDHEVLILKLDEGVAAGALLVQSATAFPAGIQYIAQLTVSGGEVGNLVLVGMKPGTYAVVDLLPNDSGVPHLALGMQATLTIT